MEIHFLPRERMCGIWFTESSHSAAEACFEKIKHRGPDISQMKRVGKSLFGFHRLSINDLSDSGNQPMTANGHHWICNGEIYNHVDILRVTNLNCHSDSDCEIIGQLFNACGDIQQVCNSLDGVFACVLLSRDGTLYAFRDRIGVRPLYYGFDEEGAVSFCSEVKGISELCMSVSEFPPGCVYSSATGQFTRFANISVQPCTAPYSCATLNGLLTSAVEKRLMSDRPVGFFLSGGLDSSLICAIGSQLLDSPLQTFSIGIGDSPDLQCARKVAKHIGSIHKEISFTAEEGHEAVRSVIYSLESYDCTTIRASVPMYLMSKYIKEHTNIRVILSGEGADELFGGYLYLHDAPTLEEFNEETERLLRGVHKHDVLRADRCVSAHGLELRVPFFDRALVDYVLKLDPAVKKTKLEKLALRSSFVDMLPHDILMRQKNGMSDAVGYSWVSHMRNVAENKYSDDYYESMCDKFLINSPKSKEELYYREIYTDLFGSVDNTGHIWRPRWTNVTDPSAALLHMHVK